MARISVLAVRAELRFPHTRGDGPGWDLVAAINGMISPHPWGWPEIRIEASELLFDFPTPVGMARFDLRISSSFARFPHTRGDGPEIESLNQSKGGISPHPWGWPGSRTYQSTVCRDFPTPVGMAHSRGDCECQRRGFPHTRGDGPLCARELVAGRLISPHPWGWPGPLPQRAAGAFRHVRTRKSSALFSNHCDRFPNQQGSLCAPWNERGGGTIRRCEHHQGAVAAEVGSAEVNYPIGAGASPRLESRWRHRRLWKNFTSCGVVTPACLKGRRRWKKAKKLPLPPIAEKHILNILAIRCIAFLDERILL